MPSLSDSLVDANSYNPVESVSRINAAAPNADSQPNRGTMMRCPLPPLFQPSPDNLRAYYQKGTIPQFRIFTPPVTPNNTGITITNNYGGSSTSTSGGATSGGGTSGGYSLSPSIANVKTVVLTPGQSYIGALSMSKSFQLLSLSANGPIRFELYGTALAQTSDAGRALDIPPAAGTVQNIICDVVLDTAPYQWAFQNRVGANGDSPQGPTAYATVTNLGSGSSAATVALTYVALEAA
jgi:hypothetical protein